MTDQQITRWFLGAVGFIGLIYICFELTPSSYGMFLDVLQAPEAGPVVGISRGIRSDEWAVATPLFQACIRNGFRRINETSFYHEDLRNFTALPLKDWSLIFKPQLWAFFVLPPALAYSIFYTLFMWAFLAGYFLFFRELEVPAWLAAVTTVIVYFSGFTQFWWTIYGFLLAGLPWILLIVLRPMAWWKKTLLCVWAFPALVLAQAYPILLVTLAWGALILLLALRPTLLRSPGEIIAIAAGSLTVALVIFFYYGNVITIMSNTVYPGHRISAAGGTSKLAALSELFPFVSFRLGDFMQLDGENICEIGAVGSFFPLLTVCLMRYRSLRDHAAVRRSLLVLLSGFAAITLWQIAPVPLWIGRILLWNRGGSQRFLFTSGFLLTMAALLIWSNKLISVHPLRIAVFVVVGPVASLFLKSAWLIHKGEPAFPSRHDLLLSAVAIGGALAACYVPPASRGYVLLFTVAWMNVYAFGRFNPLQPAGPIFEVPETEILHDLREKAAASGGVLYDTQSFGATLNGLGFPAVSHVLMAPKLVFFRSYFPAMDAERFNQIFNRFAHIRLSEKPMPGVPQEDVIDVPKDMFVPVRNIRRLVAGALRPGVCTQPSDGGIDRVLSEGVTITIDGWAPWAGESDAQGIRIESARPVRTETLTTVRRPDIAERLHDYGFVKSGFQLKISSTDGKPLQASDVAVAAFGTSYGEVRISCCGCP
jgi:hypothetical protein